MIVFNVPDWDRLSKACAILCYIALCTDWLGA